MSTHRRPEVFISATSADLRSCREMIKQALLTLQCVPVEQTNFPPDYRTVRDMLRAKIAACDAVIHVAGVVYGAEPKERAPGEPRRSYTQLEYALARELKKPLYVFVCGEDFAYDEYAPEDDEKRALQQAHRAALTASETLRYKVKSKDDLALRVRELQTAVEKLTIDLNKARSWLARGVAIGLAAVMLLGCSLWWLKQRTDAQAKEVTETKTNVSQLKTELNEQRRYIAAVGDALQQVKQELAALKLPEEELFRRAIARVAEKVGLSAEKLQTTIDLFVAGTRANPEAGSMDLALADFAERNFLSAAENARRAATGAEQKLANLAKLEESLAAEKTVMQAEVREARKLEAQSFAAARSYEPALKAYEAALVVTPRAGEALAWADLQSRLATTLIDWANVSEGPAVTERTDRAVAAHRSVLEVLTRQQFPQQWATTQNNLAIALSDQAANSFGDDAARLLTEAISACRSALEVYTRQQYPQQWAAIQNSLANALSDQATLSSGNDVRLLADAVAAYRSALEVLTRQQFPLAWAASQNNLAIALKDQAASSSSDDAARLLAEAVSAFRSSLEVRTRSQFPQDWAATQNNLAIALCAQAVRSHSDADTARLLADAVSAHRSTLEVYTRQQFPQNWAKTQNNLATALTYQAARSSVDDVIRLALGVRATRSSGDDDVRILAEAVSAYRSALEVYTRQQFPQDWASIQNNLATTLNIWAMQSSGIERLQHLQATVAAQKGALEIYTADRYPAWHKKQLAWIAQAEAEIATLETTPSGKR